MRLCCFNNNRLGVLENDTLRDVSHVLDQLPLEPWVRSIEEPVIARLDSLRSIIETALSTAPMVSVSEVALDAPVALPSKIIGAPVNYHAHLDEANEDQALHQGRKVHPIDEIGCFLKAGSSLIGSGGIIELPEAMDRVDYEGEIAIVIGTAGRTISARDAIKHVAGYTLALDMSVRGKQDRSMRKSCDGFAVLGPSLVTADEISNHKDISFELRLNNKVKQASNTSQLIRSIPELIVMCSAFYTLLPGDVIMTGTPAGVGPVDTGDLIELSSPQLGILTAQVQ